MAAQVQPARKAPRRVHHVPVRPGLRGHGLGIGELYVLEPARQTAVGAAIRQIRVVAVPYRHGGKLQRGLQHVCALKRIQSQPAEALRVGHRARKAAQLRPVRRGHIARRVAQRAPVGPVAPIHPGQQRQGQRVRVVHAVQAQRRALRPAHVVHNVRQWPSLLPHTYAGPGPGMTRAGLLVSRLTRAAARCRRREPRADGFNPAPARFPPQNRPCPLGLPPQRLPPARPPAREGRPLPDGPLLARRVIRCRRFSPCAPSPWGPQTSPAWSCACRARTRRRPRWARCRELCTCRWPCRTCA